MISRLLPARFEDTVGAGLVLVIGTIVLVQVVCRYILGMPLKWTDEGARILLAWLTFIGASAAARVNQNPRVELLRNWVRPSRRPLVDGLACGGTAVLMAIGAYYGFLLTGRLTDVRLVTIDLSWAWWYGAFPVGAVLMLFRTLQEGRRVVQGQADEPPAIVDMLPASNAEDSSP